MNNFFEGISKTNKKTHEKIDFHYSIQDWVFTTVYQLSESVWKNACNAEMFFNFIELPLIPINIKIVTNKYT